MKKFVLAAVAASLLATPAMAAPQRSDHEPHRTVERTTVVKKQVTRTPQRHYRQQPSRQQYQNVRNWQRGERFDSRYARNYRQIDYRGSSRLYAPPRGYQWVQSGNDAVLVALTSGLIGAVIGGVLAN